MALDRLSLVRAVYRSLLQSGRTYAAFEPARVSPLVERLSPRRVILDPMAGYGTLISLCSNTPTIGVSAFCVECNPPSYLWQVLINPSNAPYIISMAEYVLRSEPAWPSQNVRAHISNEWYPEASLDLLVKLLTLSREIASRLNLTQMKTDELSLAFLLPFVGRLSASVQGNVVTHVKKGGLCIYEGWQDDFRTYVLTLTDFIQRKLNAAINLEHTSILADSSAVDLSQQKFSAMITSPPYPNARDYNAMFGPENAFLQFVESEDIIKGYTLQVRLIGSPRVSMKDSSQKKGLNDVKSRSALKFLEAASNYSGAKQAVYDNKVYYVPYYAKYFYDLENAYRNIATWLDWDFEGYIIVVNNTHRKMVIPVAQVVLEIWDGLGFEASIMEEHTRELSHVGGINPKVKGFTARHTEHTIRVRRR